ncbi:competence regulator inhibitor paratox [Streptococcus dysgalactiae]|uniref:competence regulator inhibitor paratox n=1 Tax=Streptococcus dysgalactiae TaxID=1334 RepID=UPI003F540BC9
MLYYDEFKQAIDRGYITGGTVMIVRKGGAIFDYILPGEEVRPWEVVTAEVVEEVLEELEYIK